MTELERRVTDGFKKTEERFDKIEQRFEKIDARSLQQLFAIVLLLLSSLGGFVAIVVTLLHGKG